MLIRAGASNRQMVSALGVNINLLYTIVFGLGAALAGLAGLMAAPIMTVEIGMGEGILILTFVVIVIGGVGSIRGAFVAALLVGFIDTVGRSFPPGNIRTVCFQRCCRHRRTCHFFNADLYSDGTHSGDQATGTFPAKRSIDELVPSYIFNSHFDGRFSCSPNYC